MLLAFFFFVQVLSFGASFQTSRFGPSSTLTRLKVEKFDVTVVYKGVEKVIQVSSEETLLDSLEKYKPADLPTEQLYSCRAGTCGTCACLVNDPSGIEHDAEFVVDEDKREKGFILSCTAFVKKNGLVIQLNEEDAYIAA